jgi:asparagine synthase (glutamine-hydrolysing)
VENKLGRIGCHIDVDLQKSFGLDFDSNSLAVTPNCADKCANEAVKQFESWVISHRNRVLVSGIGGDEVTGGLPTAIPELEDLLARARFIRLASRLKLWALSKRKPWFHLLFEAARGFQPPEIGGVPPYMHPPSWLHRDFVKRHRSALTGYPLRVKLFGALPSFQENLSILEALRRQLACDALPSEPPYEKRYPYLDRDLLEFIFACPREQLVRPGQRRSLMRRSLVGIVPSELLNRKRKAFVVRSPLLALSTEQTRLSEMSETMLVTSFGILDPEAFRLALRKASQGQEVAIVTLMRVLGIESWLRKCGRNKILAGGPSTIMPSSAAATEDRNETEPPACEIQPASS